MPSHRRKLLPLCIAASLLTGLSGEVAAIGVGEIHLQSFLGAPLQAEIPLSHLGELDAEQLKVQLGTQGDYSAMGVDYTYQHSQLKIEPVIKNGQGYVRISTREPITEPYLNFVLSLRWPQGQVVREFTVLLDPPTQAVAAVVPSAPKPAPVNGAAFVQPEVAAAPQVTPRKRHRQMHAETAPVSTASASEGHYLIQRGDSLWRIANRMRPAQVPVEQMMVAIRELNPNAFINGNPNLLKEAAAIALPDTQQIANAGGADSSIAVAAPTNKSVEKFAEKIVAATAQPTGDTSAVTQSQLVEEQLVTENAALKTQVVDLTSNVANLNQNLVQSEQRLHQLESQLNELIQQMQQQRATVAALNGTADAPNATATTGSVINQVNAADLHGAAKAHTPWWVHLLYWLGIGGAVTWAVREHFWPQRRLAAAMGGVAAPVYEDEDRPVSKAPIMARTVIDDLPTITTVEEAAELSLDLDELTVPRASEPVATSEVAPQLMKSKDETVDASISAGVFVAFGRFAEAERLLRDAIAREPSRIDLKLQLLDVFMQSDQPGAFDDLAAEIENEARAPETLAELAVMRDSYRPRR